MYFFDVCILSFPTSGAQGQEEDMGIRRGTGSGSVFSSLKLKKLQFPQL